MATFTKDTTTDAKRLIRAEFWAKAQDQMKTKGTRKPYVVTLAGRNPAEELHVIRTLMPKAHVLMVDIDPEACRSARDAGVDEVMCGDIFTWTDMPWMTRCHVINLDLCGTLTRDVALGTKKYGNLVAKRNGVLMLTVSYGREHEKFTWKSYNQVPAPLGGRVEFVDRRVELPLDAVRSYRGRQANMCAMLWRV